MKKFLIFISVPLGIYLLIVASFVAIKNTNKNTYAVVAAGDELHIVDTRTGEKKFPSWQKG